MRPSPRDPKGQRPSARDGRWEPGASSRDWGEGAREPVARPGPAPSSSALSTPGSGARRSHDLWGRGCRSEGAGEPGRSGNKGPGSEAGAAAASYLDGPGPHGSGAGRKEALGTGTPPPFGAFTCAQVCAGEDSRLNPQAIPRLSLRLPLRTWGAQGCGEPGPLTCELSTPGQTRPERGSDVGVWGRGRARWSREVSPRRPPRSWSPAPGGRGASPPPRFPWEARGGRRWLIPTPSLTLWARGGREGEAQSPKQQRAERRATAPPAEGWGSRPPGPPGRLPWGLAICSLVAPRVGS